MKRKRVQLEKVEATPGCIATVRKRIEPFLERFWIGRGMETHEQMGMNCYTQGMSDTLSLLERRFSPGQTELENPS